MKVRNSLKAYKKKAGVQVIRRGKRVIAIDKKNPRIKVRQG